MKFVDTPAEAVQPTYDQRTFYRKPKVHLSIQDGITLVELLI
jgi:hypothetical protein